MRLSDDRGISLTEMLVVTVLMGFVLAVVYMGIQFSDAARAVADTQSQFAREVTAPINVMDASLAQRVPLAGWAMEPYTATLRMPADYAPGTILEHTYTANTNGTLGQQIHRVNGATRTLVRTVTWSTTNANRARNIPLLTYYNGSVNATNVALVDNVVVRVVTVRGGQEFSDQRRVYFRNR
jgi:type II secretory pathway pseudopilin PulG